MMDNPGNTPAPQQPANSPGAQMPPQPPAPPKKKSKVGLIIGLSCLGCLIIGGIVATCVAVTGKAVTDALEEAELGETTSQAITEAMGEEAAPAEAAPVEEKEPEPEMLKVSSVALYDEFDENAIAAEEKYKTQRILIEGEVTGIDKDILDTPYVTLNTSNQFLSVQCMFSKKDMDTLTSLKKGSTVVISGKVDGMVITNLLVKQCKVEEQ